MKTFQAAIGGKRDTTKHAGFQSVVIHKEHHQICPIGCSMPPRYWNPPSTHSNPVLKVEAFASNPVPFRGVFERAENGASWVRTS